MIEPQQLTPFDLTPAHAEELSQQINTYLKSSSPEQAWQQISKNILNQHYPFALHYFIFKTIFPTWPNHPASAPAWIPDEHTLEKANLTQAMKDLKMKNYAEFHTWSTQHFKKFWQYIIHKLGIVFNKKPDDICHLENIETPQWLPGAKLNIVNSCFTTDSQHTAIIVQDETSSLQKISYGELNRLSNQVANGLIEQGFISGDPIAIDMTMNHFAVAIYLGIIKMGGVVVSIADSFSKEEIATRLRIAKAKAIFTQDFIFRGGKQLPLYEKVVAANSPRAIVLTKNSQIDLRSDDLSWEKFLSKNENFNSVACDPMQPCNILFSSGTTADPKAIPWNHTTPIKVASDAYFHQNIQPGDILAWPTNLGWMMGPWLIFASLMNHATIALFDGVPRDRAFGKFIQDAEVTMLGVVPTLVATWRHSRCMENLDWNSIKVFSSTGECSNPEDMFYLMSLANYKPIIEYCGGTEIGGAYISSTVIQKNYPSIFTTPTLGLDLVLLNETGECSDNGEVALIPPSIGLSTELLNADHHNVYFANMPSFHQKTLRRHGDQICRFAQDAYCILGRADDAMNIGGIKVSSAEIERVLTGIPDILETAAVAVTPENYGPSQLVIYASTQKNLEVENIKKLMQQRLNQHLNPLFKISDVVFIPELPKTASNKIMRRTLRKKYVEKQQS